MTDFEKNIQDMHAAAISAMNNAADDPNNWATVVATAVNVQQVAEENQKAQLDFASAQAALKAAQAKISKA